MSSISAASIVVQYSGHHGTEGDNDNIHTFRFSQLGVARAERGSHNRVCFFLNKEVLDYGCFEHVGVRFPDD